MKKKLLILTFTFLLTIGFVNFYKASVVHCQGCGCSCAAICQTSCSWSCEGCGIIQGALVGTQCCSEATRTEGIEACPEGGGES